VITGDLAKVAIAEKWAVEVPPNEKFDQQPDNLEATLRRYTVEHLVAMAKEKNVDLGDASKKADIVAALVKVLDVPAATA
jgi:hypothetical protein